MEFSSVVYISCPIHTRNLFSVLIPPLSFHFCLKKGATKAKKTIVVLNTCQENITISTS